MVALRLFTLLLLAASIALPARADVFPYEAEGVQGDNNISDSNASSCDTVEGCYTRTGALCSANTGQMCDLQIVPAGRCTSGDTGASGCVWPRGAGRCASNTKVGCLSDAYIASGTLGDGASVMCSSLATNVCDMDTDKYGNPFNANCECQGHTPPAGTCTALDDFETCVCGGTAPVCSDGDPYRDRGGFGTALGVEIAGLPPATSFAAMGPITTGAQAPTSSPYFGIENPPSVFDPQRDPGVLGRTNAGVIHEARTTDARDIQPFGTIGNMRKIRAYGDSYWNDWAFATVQTTGTFNSHIVVFSCDPPVGWPSDGAIVVGPNPGLTPLGAADTFDQFAPWDPASQWCHSVGRDSLAFTWGANLTPAEVTGNPCPPSCKKDFDLTTTELQAFINAGAQDPDAGVQLALQSGEGRQAGAGDAMGVAAVTSITWLGFGDMRCRVQGWGNPANFLGRCSDSAVPCDMALSSPTGVNPACTLMDEVCRACMGPVDAGNPSLTNGRPNAEGRPPGYNTHGLPELDLKVHERIGGIAGNPGAVRVPLFVVGTSGYAGSLFNDIPNEGAPADLADMGEVLTIVGGGTPFGPGVGTGGTFANPSTLPIGESCCAAGTGPGGSVVWSAAQNGTFADPGAFPWGGGLRTYDVGPGPNGIPGCIGDNAAAGNGINACNNRLGDQTVTGNASDGFYATGQDDIPITYDIGGNVIPASTARFPWRNADPSVVAHFSAPPYSYVSPNPPTVSTIAAFMLRDLTLFVTQNTDVAVKVSTTQCPIVGGNAVCTGSAPPPPDQDGDGVPDATDNCISIPNADQADTDADLVGQVCDNCTGASNPRTPAAFLAIRTWWTLTGGQRDDDNDGFGNRCDGDFPGTTGGNVGPADLAQFRASNGESREVDTCGTINTRPCAIYDLDENTTTANNIGPGDLARFRALQGSPAGPKCATCPLTCTEGEPGGSCP